MATRRERVILELQDQMSTGLIKAAAAANALDKALDDVDGSNVDASRSTRDLGDEVEKTTRRTKQYTLEMAVADEKARRFKKSLQDQAKAAVDAEQGIGALGDDVDRLGDSSRRTSNDIDRFSGRLGLLAKGAAAVGPSLIPIGAVAVPAISGLASQLGFAAVGAGTLITAFQGVGDAMEAVNEAALEPTAENLEAAAEAMSRISPEAQQFVDRFQELRPVLTDIRDAAAAGWFPGLTDALGNLEAIAPNIERIFRAIGEVGGNLASEGSAWFTGQQGQQFLDFIAREAPSALDTLGRTVGNLAAGMAELWQAFTPLNNDFGDWLLNISRDFAQWSDELSSTEGFREFVQYVRESGPQVASAFAAIGDALVQIVQAAAPLGGPTLQVIEALGEALATIADSSLGTPLLTAVSAMSALSLATRGVSGALGLVGIEADRAKGKMSGLASVKMAGIVAGLAAATEGLRMLGNEVDQVNLERNLEALAGGGAARGGLQDLRKDFEILNGTATNFTEPLAEIITGFGILGDTPIDAARGNIESVDQALARMVESGNAEQARETMEELAGQYAGLDHAITPSPDFVNRFGAYSTALENAGESAAGAKPAVDAYSASALASSRNAAQAAAKEREHASALRATTDAALGAFSAVTGYREALKEARKQANKNNAGINGMSKAALDNRRTIETLAGSWNQLAREGNATDKQFEQARRQFIRTAEGMGVPKQRAKELADQLLDIPSQVKTDVSLQGAGAAISTVASLSAQVSALNGKTATAYVNVVRRGQMSGVNPLDPYGSADGGTVPGQRQPYGDKIFAMLAPGEEVISNRHGQADRFRADRAAGKIPAYADGGTVGDRERRQRERERRRDLRDAQRDFNILPRRMDRGDVRSELASFRRDVRAAGVDWTRSLRRMSGSLMDTSRSLDKHRDQLDKARDGLRDLRAERRDYASQVGGMFNQDPFGGLGLQSTVWKLEDDIKGAQEWRGALRNVRKLGLRGEAFKAFAASGDMETALDIDTRGEAKQLQQLYDRRAREQRLVGRVAAGAVYNQAGARQSAEVRHLTNTVNRLESRLERLGGQLETARPIAQNFPTTADPRAAADAAGASVVAALSARGR